MVFRVGERGREEPLSVSFACGGRQGSHPSPCIEYGQALSPERERGSALTSSLLRHWLSGLAVMDFRFLAMLGMTGGGLGMTGGGFGLFQEGCHPHHLE